MTEWKTTSLDASRLHPAVAVGLIVGSPDKIVKIHLVTSQILSHRMFRRHRGRSR